MKEIPTSYWPFELDHINDYAWVHDVFSKEECKKIINLCNKLPEETAKVGGGGTTKVNTKTRDTEVRWLQPGHDASIFSKLTSATLNLNKDFFKFDLDGFMEGIQFTRYHKGMFYKPHVDRSFNCPIRKLSISVLLSDPKTFKGGDLKIENTIPEAKQGTLIAFPSFMVHQVTPVKQGERCSLVGWITGPNFK